MPGTVRVAQGFPAEPVYGRTSLEERGGLTLPTHVAGEIVPV